MFPVELERRVQLSPTHYTHTGFHTVLVQYVYSRDMSHVECSLSVQGLLSNERLNRSAGKLGAHFQNFIQCFQFMHLYIILFSQNFLQQFLERTFKLVCFPLWKQAPKLQSTCKIKNCDIRKAKQHNFHREALNI